MGAVLLLRSMLPLWQVLHHFTLSKTAAANSLTLLLHSLSISGFRTIDEEKSEC